MRKIIAALLFLYAVWQIISSISTATQYGSGQGLGQIIWAILAIVAGVYLWKKSKK
ncbi:MAG: hypothetical protein ISS43_00135 [Candidatus Omnitrophica bacterium]|nr:hypothetical protein [Candidatus Omnitrophota bacterium]